MTGEALRMKIELARLASRHGVSPKPFAPVEPLPAADGDWIVQGLASPSVVDSERCRFASNCWTPFGDVPLLYRHDSDRPAGKILELRNTVEGLYVRACAVDSEAKRCQFFSVAATIHAYQLCDVDDPEKFCANVASATLVHVALTNSPANPAAIIEHRYRQSPAVEKYDILLGWTACMQKFVGALQVINAAGARPAAPSAAIAAVPRVAPASVRRPPKTEFAKLVQEMNHHEHRRSQGA